jgi:hypothetical protein
MYYYSYVLTASILEFLHLSHCKISRQLLIGFGKVHSPGVDIGTIIGVGVGVGVGVGDGDGVEVGNDVGITVGAAVGIAVGTVVGIAVAICVGIGVGFGVDITSIGLTVITLVCVQFLPLTSAPYGP